MHLARSEVFTAVMIPTTSLNGCLEHGCGRFYSGMFVYLWHTWLSVRLPWWHVVLLCFLRSLETLFNWHRRSRYSPSIHKTGFLLPVAFLCSTGGTLLAWLILVFARR